MLWLEVNLCLIVYARRYIDSTRFSISYWSEDETEAGRRVARASNLWEETPEAQREKERFSLEEALVALTLSCPMFNISTSFFMKFELISINQSIRASEPRTYRAIPLYGGSR